MLRNKIFSVFAILSMMVMTWACTDPYEYEVVGEALSEARPVSPSAGTQIQLNSGTPNQGISFSWQAATSGLGSSVTYRVVIDRVGGDFSNPILAVASNNGGAATTASITHKQLNDALTAANITTFLWAIESNNGTTKTITGVANQVSAQRFAEGITSFNYTFPEPNQRLDLDKIRKGNEQIVFRWTPAQSTSGAAVKYKWVADHRGGNFSNPLLSIDSDENGSQPRLTVTHGQLVDLLKGINFDTGLDWKVIASAGSFTYSPATQFVWFTVFDVPNLYILGDATAAGWNNNTTDPIELTKQGEGIFSRMVFLEGGKDAKLVMVRGSWDVNWGIPDIGGPFVEGQNYPLVSGGPNIKVPETGNWIVTVNFITGTFSATKFRAPNNMYLVGGSTSADWNPANAIPFVKMSEGMFEVYAYIQTAGFGFKFLEQRDWPGDWGMKPGEPGKLTQEGEDNLNVPENGFYRIQLNFFDMSYTLTKMTWGIIGSATPLGWGDDTPMTFQGGLGSYTWAIETILTDGEIKFRANKDWGINFGDDGLNKTLEYNGANIPVSAGNYLVELILDPVSGYTYRLTKR
jgi:hypothetical protein